MDDGSGRTGGAVCPHVNRDDFRCSSRFRLDRIDQAFMVCFGSYHTCPMYHRINAERDAAPAAEPPLITVTVDGSSLPLRATGT